MFLTVASISCGGPKDNNFVIEGNIAGLRDSVDVILFKTVDIVSGLGRRVMNDTLIDGRFSFDIALEDSLDKYDVILIDSSGEIPSLSTTIFAEPGGKAVIKGSGTWPLDWNVRSTVRKQKDWQTYQDYIVDSQRETEDALNDKSLPREKRSALLDSLQRLTVEKKLEYLENEKVSDVWEYEFHSAARYVGAFKDKAVRDRLSALLPRVSEERMKSPLMADSLPYLDVAIPLNVGDAFPEIDFFDAYGLPHRVSEYSGKKVLIELSEFGCAPCVHSVPEIEELCKADPDGFVAIIINQDGYEAWKNEFKASQVPNKLEFNDAYGSSGIFLRLGTKGYPTFVLVSPEGIILDIWPGYAEGLIKEKLQQQTD